MLGRKHPSGAGGGGPVDGSGRGAADAKAAAAPAALDSLREENRRLARAVEELSVLNDLARSIGASRNSQQIIEKIVGRSRQAVGAQQAVITLVDRASDEAKTLVRVMESSVGRQQFHMNQGLLGYMLTHKRPLLTNAADQEPALRGVPMDEGVRSLLCVPLVVKSELTGVLTACNKKGGGSFTDEDQRLLTIIAGQSAQVIETARLYEKEATLAVMQEQVRLAREIQLGLLPHSPPVVPGYDIAGASIPAQEVGGDYFDFIPIEGGRWAVCLGDVSGKGLPASLLMSNLQATLRGQAHFNPDVCECLVWSNRLLFRSTDPEKFATCFYGVLDPGLHRLCYCNAGHERPMLFSAEGEAPPLRLGKGGLILGAVEEWAYESESVALAPGDLLVIYSDGVSDAVNAAEEAFGEARLAQLVRAVRHEPAARVVQAVVDAVTLHAGGTPQMDDVTVVVARRT